MANPHTQFSQGLIEYLGESEFLTELIKALPEDEYIELLEYIARNHDYEPEDENERYDTEQREDERNTAHDLW